MLNLVEQQLVGPNGGEPLSFKNDLFGPLGDRLTLISDFKKPIKEDSQRDAAGRRPRGRQGVPGDAQPALRDHPGARRRSGSSRARRSTTSTCPTCPTPTPPGAALQGSDQLRGRQEHVLRHHATRPCWSRCSGRATPTWRRTPAFQAVVKEMPERVSGMTFVRPDESARLLYDLVKSGQYEKAIQQMLGANARAAQAAADAPDRQGDPQREAPRFLRLSPSTSRWAGATASWMTTASR